MDRFLIQHNCRNNNCSRIDTTMDGVSYSATAPPRAEALIYHTDPYAFFRFSHIERVRCAGPQKIIDANDRRNADPGEDYFIAHAMIDDDQQNGLDTLDTIIRGKYNRLSSYQKKCLENAAATERYMKAIIAKSKVQVTESHCHSAIRVSSGTNPHVYVSEEPRRLIDYSTEDAGFLGWMGLYDEMDGESNTLEPILRNFMRRIAGPGDYISILEDIDESGEFYHGHRDFFEPVFRQHWKRMADDFKTIPEETAKWSVERVNFTSILMPVLQDENHIYLSCPTSAYILPQTKELTMPTPYKSRNFERTTVGDNNNDYGIWFEATDNGVFHGFSPVASEAEGGTYVMGLDDEVLIFSIDGPGDAINSRWKCHIDQWKRMWKSAFGSTTIRIDNDELS